MHNLLLLVFTLITIPYVAAASQTNVSVKTKVPRSKSIPLNLKNWTLKPKLEINFGSSSNPLQNSKEQRGSYSEYSPTLSTDYALTDDFYLIGKIKANVRRFQEKSLSETANTQSMTATFGFLSFLGENFEYGGDLTRQGSKEQELNSDIGADISETSKYQSQNSRVYFAFQKNRNRTEIGASYLVRDYTTPTKDRDLNDNVLSFENDYFGTGTDAKVEIDLAPFTLGLKGSWAERNYLNRRARFTDGPNSAALAHPRLKLFMQNYALELISKLKNLKLSTAAKYGQNKDRIYGALDSKQYSLGQTLSYSITKSVRLEPEIELTHRNFSNLRTHFEAGKNPQFNSLRKDRMTTSSLALVGKLFDRIEGKIKYSYLRMASNSAADQFNEKILMTGLSADF